MTKAKLDYMRALASMMLKCKDCENCGKCAGVCEDTVGYDAIVRDGNLADTAPIVSQSNLTKEI